MSICQHDPRQSFQTSSILTAALRELCCHVFVHQNTKRCKSPQHLLSFPTGPIERFFCRQMAICISLCATVLWCYHILVHAVEHTKMKSRYNRHNSAQFYNKHCKGCFTLCRARFNWFKPRMNLLRLSHSNRLIMVTVKVKQSCKYYYYKYCHQLNRHSSFYWCFVCTVFIIYFFNTHSTILYWKLQSNYMFTVWYC